MSESPAPRRIPPFGGVTVTIEEKLDAPPGVYTFTISCPHRDPYTSECLPDHIVKVHMNGNDVYARAQGVPEITPRRPKRRVLINGFMEHMGHHGDTFDQCGCWQDAAMRIGPDHHTISNMVAVYSAN